MDIKRRQLLQAICYCGLMPSVLLMAERPAYADGGEGGDGGGESGGGDSGGGGSGGGDSGGGSSGGGESGGGGPSGGSGGGGHDGHDQSGGSQSLFGGPVPGGKDDGKDNADNGNATLFSRGHVLLGHEDALNARKAGEIISLKDALSAVPTNSGKVIEIKLFRNFGRAVYRIKVRDKDGLISTYRIDARTGQKKGLF